jgi:hypothetical protein
MQTYGNHLISDEFASLNKKFDAIYKQNNSDVDNRSKKN